MRSNNQNIRRLAALALALAVLLLAGCSSQKDQVLRSIRNSARAEDLDRAETFALDYLEIHGQEPDMYLALADCYSLAGEGEKADRMREISWNLMYPEEAQAQDTSGGPASESVSEPASGPEIYQDEDSLILQEDPRLEGVFPTGEEYQVNGKPIGQYTPEELWAWAPRAEAPSDQYEDQSENGWYLQQKFQNFVLQVNWAPALGLSGPWQTEVTVCYLPGTFNGEPSDQVMEIPQVLPREIQPEDSPAQILEKMGLPQDLAQSCAEYGECTITLGKEGTILRAGQKGDCSEQTFRFVYEEGWGDFEGESRFYFPNGHLDRYTIACVVGRGPAD